MFWLSEKIAGVFHSIFGKSDAQGLSPGHLAQLESLDFVEGISKMGNTHSILTNKTSKNGNLIHLYLSDDGRTLHDGGQVLTNTSELVMETQVVSNLPPNVKLVDGYLVNESLTGTIDADLAEMRSLLEFVQGY